MSIFSSVGVGSADDAHAAGTNAAQDALDHFSRDVKPNVCIVFTSSHYDARSVVAGIISVIGPNVEIVGCTTAGEIASNGPVKVNSVTVQLLGSNTVKFFTSVGEGIEQNARAAGKIAAEELKLKAEGHELGLAIMLSDVLVGNGADTVRGVLDALGLEFPIIGGAAGDNFKFEKTFVIHNQYVYSGAVVMLGLTKEAKIGVGVRHGWMPVGSPRTVTKSEGARIYEFDHKPAMSLYEDYFGEDSLELRTTTLAKLAITYPIGIRVPSQQEMLIRDPLKVNKDGSIVCAAEVPQGSEIQLMVGSKEEAIEAAKQAALQAVKDLNGAQPGAILIFNCIARNKLFGEDVGQEISAIHQAIGIQVPLAGFYTYGEIAPIQGSTHAIGACASEFHNETVVVAVLA